MQKHAKGAKVSIRQDAATLLASALRDLPGATYEVSDDSSIHLQLPNGSTYELVLTFPGDTRYEESGTPVYVLHRSTGYTRSRGPSTSYVDLARGAVRLVLPSFFVEREGLTIERAEPTWEATRGYNPFADRASKIVRLLLSNPAERRWSVTELANEAEVDVATASRASRGLRDQNLIQDEAPGQGKRSRIWVPQPMRLLETWVQRYNWRENARRPFRVRMGDPRRFLNRLPELLGEPMSEGRCRWALTLHSGAALEAPLADWDKAHVYLGPTTLPEVEDPMPPRTWEPAEDGRLVLLRAHHAESVWFGVRELEGLPVVSTVQLVLDLWDYPVRGREQARHLIETVLEPVWEETDEFDG